MKIERGMLENISTVVKIEQERRDQECWRAEIALLNDEN